MKIKLIRSTSEPLTVLATAARTCYTDIDPARLDQDISQEEAKSLINKIMSIGHYSVLEHVVFTFSVSGISRACSHQLVRHRLASFSQRSQRYVKHNRPDIVTPKSIDEHPVCSNRFVELIESIWEEYNTMVGNGIPPEDARFVLPNACATALIFTMNARELLHFFTLRGCNRAQWEIRAMSDKMLKICKAKLPIVFDHAGPACVRGSCSEGKMSCGKPRDKELTGPLINEGSKK